MNRLEKANKYQLEHTSRAGDRPVYHLSPPTGWMNDPNGFSFYKGHIHLFYQYHPFSDSWGSMFWGHAVSSDFISWRDLPVALAPDDSYDSGGCFSGSAVEKDGRQILIYTGSVKKRDESRERIVLQQQCLASGDGLVYEKYDKNPIIPADMLPPGFQKAEFRDPKIIRNGNAFHVVTAAMDNEGLGHILLYRSFDLLHWEFVSELGADATRTYEVMWECPDLFSLADLGVLLVSPIELPEKVGAGERLGPLALVGQMNWKVSDLEDISVSRLDYGCDFYAPQTMEMPDGRRVMVAWMQSWNNYIKPRSQKWNGMMTIPRELDIEEGRLIQRPVRELMDHRTAPVVHSGIRLPENGSIKGIAGRSMDLTIILDEDASAPFEVKFAAHGDQYGIACCWNKDEKALVFRRRKAPDSVTETDAFSEQRMPLERVKFPLKLRFLLDTFSLELFIDDGVQVFTSTFWAPLDWKSVFFSSKGLAAVDIESYTIAEKT